MTYNRGDQVLVEFMGELCEGEVLRHSSGYVMAQVTLPDVEVDFGSISPRIDPQPTVCVQESRVRPLT